jgi:hypothetical protein
MTPEEYKAHFKKKETRKNKFDHRKFQFKIGIDPGIKCGFAIFDSKDCVLTRVKCFKMYELLDTLGRLGKDGDHYVFIENPNSYMAFKSKLNTSKLKGAGAVKQTYKHIIEMMEDMDIPYSNTSVMSKTNKLDAETFKKYTKWEGVTNEHSRDAAMLVFNRK